MHQLMSHHRMPAGCGEMHPVHTMCTLNAMIFTSDAERNFADCVAKLVYTNPFLPERIERERAALGEAFIEGDRVWNALADPQRELSNVCTIGDRADALVRSLRERLATGAKASREELDLYEQLVFYVLYH